MHYPLGYYIEVVRTFTWSLTIQYTSSSSSTGFDSHLCLRVRAASLGPHSIQFPTEKRQTISKSRTRSTYTLRVWAQRLSYGGLTHLLLIREGRSSLDPSVQVIISIVVVSFTGFEHGTHTIGYVTSQIRLGDQRVFPLRLSFLLGSISALFAHLQPLIIESIMSGVIYPSSCQQLSTSEL